VLALAGFSLVFHLTKGLDYEEAAFSAVLLAVLIAARRAFTVLSGGPEIGWTGPSNSGQTRVPGGLATSLSPPPTRLSVQK